MVDNETKIINMILKRKTFLCHDICSDNIFCNKDNCDICYNIKRKMRNRYKKFNSSYDIHIERCSKKHCIYDALIENIIDDDEKDLDAEKLKIKKSYNKYVYYPIPN